MITLIALDPTLNTTALDKGINKISADMTVLSFSSFFYYFALTFFSPPDDSEEVISQKVRRYPPAARNEGHPPLSEKMTRSV